MANAALHKCWHYRITATKKEQPHLFFPKRLRNSFYALMQEESLFYPSFRLCHLSFVVSFDIPYIDEVRMVDAEKGVGRQYVFVFFEIFYRYDLFPSSGKKKCICRWLRTV